ncbi:MAG: ribonuclease R [Proteocatella sp.]
MRKNISERILELMNEEAYKNLTFKELSAIFTSGKKDEERLNGILESLIEEGEVYKTKKGKFGLSVKNGFVKGPVKINPKGFGFVLQDEEDIYVSSSNLGTAMDGDLVLAKIVGEKDEKSSTEGEIVKVLKRNTDIIVGVFVESKNFGFVIPTDSRQSYDVFVTGKNMHDAKNRDIVVCKIMTYPTKNKKPEGKIIEILGKKNDLSVEIQSEIIQKKVRTEFAKKVMSYANSLDAKVSEEEIKKRKDLRNELVFTIDGEDAKDLDDAISITKKENGNYVLGVHIADVTHYVKENSPIDQEAVLRGTSIYFANRVIPMLPKEISNNLCSLNPNEAKLTLSCIMEINSKGKVVDYEIANSVIESDFRLTYNGVTNFIEGKTDNAISKYNSPELETALNISLELSKILEESKRKRGSIDFDFPESKFVIEDNQVVGVEKRAYGVANKIIEEFMISANELIAEVFCVQEVPFLYRVHEDPNEEKLANIFKFLKNMNIDVKLRKDGEIHSSDIQKIIEATKDLDQSTIISYALLRSLKKARYSPDSIGHFGLAAKYYTHFTSPIRRYPDLQIHRIIKESISGSLDEKRMKHYDGILNHIADQSSDMEVQSMEIERNIDDLLKCHYMKHEIGNEFEGMIVSITNFGMFIMMDNTVEGLVRFADMKSDYFIFDETNYCARGERSGKVYTVGNKVNTRVDSVDFAFKEIRLAII